MKGCGLVGEESFAGINGAWSDGGKGVVMKDETGIGTKGGAGVAAFWEERERARGMATRVWGEIGRS